MYKVLFALIVEEHGWLRASIPQIDLSRTSISEPDPDRVECDLRHHSNIVVFCIDS